MGLGHFDIKCLRQGVNFRPHLPVHSIDLTGARAKLKLLVPTQEAAGRARERYGRERGRIFLPQVLQDDPQEKSVTP